MSLSPEQIQVRLQEIPNWQYQAGKICRRYRFDSYADGAAFALRVALLAERLDHHPDSMTIAWQEVELCYVTHSEGGVSDHDFEAAKTVESLYARFGGI
jgi:4a-hydroxytetrahydrobiopterin dehydratase